MDQSPAKRRLLFVYNADGGTLSALIDAAHKLVSPATYPCALCAITYGAVAMRSEWRDAVLRLPVPAQFLHRDEYRKEFPASTETLPAIFLQKGDAPPALLVAAAQMSNDQSVAQLIALLEGALNRALAPAVNRALDRS